MDAATRQGGVLELPPRRLADSRYALDFVVPLAGTDGMAPVAVLRCDLACSLAIHFTPFADLDADLRFALSMRRADGVDVLSWAAGNPDMTLVDDGERAAAALEPRPLATTAAATATVRGHDVRGTRVLAAQHAVPGTDWWLTASEPLHAVAAHTIALVAWLVLAAILGLALGAVGLALQRQRREVHLLHALNVDRAEQIDALRVFEAIIENSPDAIFARSGRPLRAVESWLRRVPRPATRSEVLGRTDEGIFSADEAAKSSTSTVTCWRTRAFCVTRMPHYTGGTARPADHQGAPARCAR